jgi:SAM-dependent methyltransferase
VPGRWLDTSEVHAWPARAFAARFRPALDNADYRAALPQRRRRLVDEQRDLLPRRTVLELGPHTGGLTAGIARYAKRVTGIEGNRRAVEVLAHRLGRRVEIVVGDLHRELGGAGGGARTT